MTKSIYQSIEVREDGNNRISPLQWRIWNFKTTVLLKFQCPIEVEVRGPDVPRRFDQYINFFVPNNHSRQDEVIAYIKQEWAHECREPKEEDDTWFWGSVVTINMYEGNNLHTDYAEIQKMSQNMLLYLEAKLKGKNTAAIEDFSSDKTKSVN